MRATARWVTLACLSTAMAACTGQSGPPASPATSVRASDPASPDPASTTTWLAALRVESEPDALDEDTQALTDVLGGSLVVSPAACLRGLPAEVEGSAYVLGVVAPDRAKLDDLVARTDRDPIFRLEVEILCSD